MKFKLVSDYAPKGDQPKAIEEISSNIMNGVPNQTLLGVTGSGKTFTMACVIEKVQKPTLIIAHNKTLAAQLYNEFKLFFPENAVEYFVSYYDYYQPEAYIPTTDTYIEKDSAINDEINMLRHSATRSLLEREDVLIVASVSCIYGLGSPEEYKDKILLIKEGKDFPRDDLLSQLTAMHYERNNIDFRRGTFRNNGDIVDIFPAYEGERAIRVEFFGDTIERISKIDALTGKSVSGHSRIIVYPNSHYVASDNTMARAMESIKAELAQRLTELENSGKLVEAQRLRNKTMFDLEMIKELGYCHGIENYSRHLTGRKVGEAPPVLIDYFPSDYLLFIDESHATIPQIGGMYAGDRSRKTTLVEHGFRLPSALDNRPLNFEEFEGRVNQAVYVSATPAEYEINKSEGIIIEQLIRPTGLVDPLIDIRPVTGQIDDLLHEIRLAVEKGEKILVTTLTKRFSENLSQYYRDVGVRVEYLHSDIKTIERMEIIRGLRKSEFDVLVGINLLREGLDIPEVSLVAILDADKEGFLRSERSLIQTSGRAARNVSGRVIMYADTITGSIKRAVDEMNRRRDVQLAYNNEHGITPQSVIREIHSSMGSSYEANERLLSQVAEGESRYMTANEIESLLKKLKKEMREAAKELEFEKAAGIRDRIKELEKVALSYL